MNAILGWRNRWVLVLTCVLLGAAVSTQEAVGQELTWRNLKGLADSIADQQCSFDVSLPADTSMILHCPYAGAVVAGFKFNKKVKGAQIVKLLPGANAAKSILDPLGTVELHDAMVLLVPYKMEFELPDDFGVHKDSWGPEVEYESGVYLYFTVAGDKLLPSQLVGTEPLRIAMSAQMSLDELTAEVTPEFTVGIHRPGSHALPIATKITLEDLQAEFAVPADASELGIDIEGDMAIDGKDQIWVKLGQTFKKDDVTQKWVVDPLQRRLGFEPDGPITFEYVKTMSMALLGVTNLGVVDTYLGHLFDQLQLSRISPTPDDADCEDRLLCLELQGNDRLPLVKINDANVRLAQKDVFTIHTFSLDQYGNLNIDADTDFSFEEAGFGLGYEGKIVVDPSKKFTFRGNASITIAGEKIALPKSGLSGNEEKITMSMDTGCVPPMLSFSLTFKPGDPLPTKAEVDENVGECVLEVGRAVVAAAEAVWAGTTIVAEEVGRAFVEMGGAIADAAGDVEDAWNSAFNQADEEDRDRPVPPPAANLDVLGPIQLVRQKAFDEWPDDLGSREKKLCPPGTVISGIRTDVSSDTSDSSGVNGMAVKCTEPPGWETVPGEAVVIDVDAQGHAWSLGRNGTIYQHDGSIWNQRGNRCAKEIGIGGGKVWIIGCDRNVYRWSGQAFVPMGADTADAEDSIYKYDGSGWDQVGGCAKDIGIGANGSVWVIGCDPQAGGWGIHRWNGTTFVQTPGSGVRIDVDPQGNAWLVNSAGHIYKYDSGWARVEGCAKDIGIGKDGVPWIVGCRRGNNGWSIHRRTSGGPREVLEDGTTHASVAGTWAECPPGTFAQGFQLKVQDDQNESNDNGLTGVKLTCKHPMSGASAKITSQGHAAGDWRAEVLCADGPLTGFRLSAREKNSRPKPRTMPSIFEGLADIQLPPLPQDEVSIYNAEFRCGSRWLSTENPLKGWGLLTWKDNWNYTREGFMTDTNELVKKRKEWLENHKSGSFGKCEIQRYEELLNPTPTPGYYRIKNRWDDNRIINVQNGLKGTKSTDVQPGWHSADWTLEPVPGTAYVRIKNRSKKTYLHIGNGAVEAGPIAAGSWSSHWLREVGSGGDYNRMKNRWKGTYLDLDPGDRSRLIVSSDENRYNTARWAFIHKPSLPDGEYRIYSQSGCPGGAWCNAELSYDGVTDGFLDATVENDDTGVWHIEHKRDNLYEIRNHYAQNQNWNWALYFDAIDFPGGIVKLNRARMSGPDNGNWWTLIDAGDGNYRIRFTSDYTKEEIAATTTDGGKRGSKLYLNDFSHAELAPDMFFALKGHPNVAVKCNQPDQSTAWKFVPHP